MGKERFDPEQPRPVPLVPMLSGGGVVKILTVRPWFHRRKVPALEKKGCGMIHFGFRMHTWNVPVAQVKGPVRVRRSGCRSEGCRL